MIPPGLLELPNLWFCYDPSDGYEEYATEEKARAAAEKAIDYYRDDAPSDGWSDEVMGVRYGKIHGWTVETMRKSKPSANELDEDGMDQDGTYWGEWDEVCDYGLSEAIPAPQVAAVDAFEETRKRVMLASERDRERYLQHAIDMGQSPAPEPAGTPETDAVEATEQRIWEDHYHAMVVHARSLELSRNAERTERLEWQRRAEAAEADLIGARKFRDLNREQRDEAQEDLAAAEARLADSIPLADVKPLMKALGDIADTDDWRGVAKALVAAHRFTELHPDAKP